MITVFLKILNSEVPISGFLDVGCLKGIALTTQRAALTLIEVQDNGQFIDPRVLAELIKSIQMIGKNCPHIIEWTGLEKMLSLLSRLETVLGNQRAIVDSAILLNFKAVGKRAIKNDEDMYNLIDEFYKLDRTNSQKLS